MAAPRVLTTGRLAKLIDVCPRTVANWIDRGRLPAYRLGKDRDRRVKIQDALAFVYANGYPHEELEAYAVRCGVAVSSPPTLLLYSPSYTLTQYFNSRNGAYFNVTHASSPLLCGLLWRERSYEALVVDQAIGSREAEDVLALACGKRPRPRIVLVANEDDKRSEGMLWAPDDYYRRPVDFAALARELFRRLRAVSPRKAG